MRSKIARSKQQLAATARDVEASKYFDLSFPIGLLLSNRVVHTTIGGLSAHLPASPALSSPEIERFLLLRAEHGFDRAFELCSSDSEDGEAFCRAWDEAQADLSNGALVTVTDLVDMTIKAREGWLAKPRELLVLAVEGRRVEYALCPTPWFFS